ncbi:amidohydrolase family protein [Candidatus Saccharibacteria bacterium]|nr:amidohydrolase family protein [Candidatus Saccharibacteria bacterium]
MGQKIILPGLIDPHVHLRDPGQTHKEDFLTGTSAALAGGYTTIFDMPNNAEPITTEERLNTKIASAQNQVVCDVGFHFGTLGDNFDEFEKVIDKVSGLKIYMNVTTGNFIINSDKLIEIYKAWPGTKPILLHAEDDVSDIVFKTLREIKTPTHICHVSSEAELTFVMKAKEEGLPITCGVTPHHLFLTDRDAEEKGAWAHMKPSLKTQKDQDFIWRHMDAVDIIESDHAPHTKAEKQGNPPPFGVPGLETTLPLMLTAEQKGKLSRQQLIDRLHTNPAKIFDVSVDKSTTIEVDMDEFEISNEKMLTKCGWSPFAGQRVVGEVQKVTIRGSIVFENGEVLVSPGSGKIIN